MKEEGFNRLASGFMAVCMLAGLLLTAGQPMSAYAEETSDNVQNPTVTEEVYQEKPPGENMGNTLLFKTDMVMTSGATQIPSGDYTISTNGDYQLDEEYTGVITIAGDVNTVKIIGSSEHVDASIVIAGDRTEAIDLTIENLNITSQPNSSPVDFGNAGDYPHRLYISGTCRLEALDWAPSAALRVPDGVQLTINRAAGLSSDSQAQMTVIGGKWSSGIGGSDNEAGGSITISGGTITATGGSYGAGIGGGRNGAGENITIEGGTITAIGGNSGAGIGGGRYGAGGNITISGGIVNAAGGPSEPAGGAAIGGGRAGSGTNITISGGEVTAQGGHRSAGIGGGGWSSSSDGTDNYGSGSNITISGGTVTATGGDYGAGIGGGIHGTGGGILISAGTVTANGGKFGAGIGGGYEASAGDITISGGSVTSAGGIWGGAGIGGGFEGNGGAVTIIGAPMIIAKGSSEINVGENIGKGAFVEDSGTLKNGDGEDLAYLLFNTDGIANVNLTIEGMGEYFTGSQGLCGIIVPRPGSVAYTAGKGGYAAVRGTEPVSFANHTIDLGMIEDNTPPTVSNVTPLIMNECIPVEVTCYDDYGIYGTLYLVPKANEAYTSKADLDGIDTKRTEYLESPVTSVGIATSGLEDGAYQVYLADSAENVSSPSENIVIDTAPPVLDSAERNDNTHITVTLSENCTGLTKDSSGGFIVHESGNSGIIYEVTSITQADDARCVILTVADMGISAKEGVTVKYTSVGDGTVQDMAGNYMTTDSTGIMLAAWDTTAPAIDEAVIGGGNAYIDVFFSEGVCGADDGTSPLTKEKLALVFAQNEGTAVSAEISSVKRNDSTVGDIAAELTGGETVVRVFLVISGTPSGFESIEIKPADGSSIFDTAGNAMADAQTTGARILSDLKAPAVGDGGTISADSITHSSMYLAWTAASDEATDQADLMYRIVSSTENNIDSVESAEENGIVEEDWCRSLTGWQAAELTANTAYYFNVIVRDQAGNKAAYNTVRVSTRGMGGSSRTPAAVPKLTAEISSAYEKILAEVVYDSGPGNAAVWVDEKSLNRLLERAEAYESGTETIVVNMPLVEAARAYTLETSITGLSSGGTRNKILLNTILGTVGIPDNMLTGWEEAAGEKMAVTISRGDKAGLPPNVKDIIGDRPLVQFTLAVDGKQMDWNNPDAPVTVSIPYEPTAEELSDPEHITVWYIDGSGSVVGVPTGRYDPVTGTVTFATTHFSNYAVAYVKKTFNDLNSVEWARKPIVVLASKGIVKGATDNEYYPSINITRAEFLYSLVRTLGVDARIEGNFDDIDKNAYYCRELAIAKRLGITSGTGNNKFSPDASITRQDMMVLTERVLRMLNRLKAQVSASELDTFADKALVADYAADSIAALVKEGLIVGGGSKVNPLGNTTRAEAAVFLYRIYGKFQ